LQETLDTFDERGVIESSAEAVITEYLKYHLEKREELMLLDSVQPWKWQDLVTEWQFIPADSKVRGVVVYGFLLEERTRETRVVFPIEDFPEIARLSFEDGWLDFLEKADPDYRYRDLATEAEAARYQLQVDLFESPLPSAIGMPMVPILLKALYKRHLSRYAVQHLQVISGKSFGYHPEMLWHDQKKVFEKWEAWWEDVRDKEAPREGENEPL
jgi:hypothetical protein